MRDHALRVDDDGARVTDDPAANPAAGAERNQRKAFAPSERDERGDFFRRRGAHDRGGKPRWDRRPVRSEGDEVALPEILRARDALRNVEAHVTRKALGEQARDIGRFRHAKLVLRFQLAECLERDACASWSGPRGCTANAAACLVGRSKPRLAAVAEAECERGVTTARAAERSERSPEP